MVAKFGAFIGAAMAMALGAGKIFMKLPFWQRATNKKTRPRVLAKSPLGHFHFYGKASHRIYQKMNAAIRNGSIYPATPTSTTLTAEDGKTRYRIFSDGSYRRVENIGRGRRIIVAE